MSSYSWIKLYHEILRDPKMGKLPDTLWRRAIELFLVAGETGKDGFLPNLFDLSWLLRVQVEQLELEFLDLEKCRIIEQRDGKWYVTNFAKRQAPIDVNERVSEHRERKRRGKYYENEDPQSGNESETNRYTDKNRSETDTDTEHLAAPASTRKKPREPKPEKETCPREWMTAILKLCGSDNAKASPGLRKRASQCGIVLIKDGKTLDDLNRFGVWWYANDWRGKRGEPPTPDQIRDAWEKQNGKQTNATSKSRSSVEYSPSDIAAAAEVTRRNRERAAAATVGAVMPAM